MNKLDKLFLGKVGEDRVVIDSPIESNCAVPCCLPREEDKDEEVEELVAVDVEGAGGMEVLFDDGFNRDASLILSRHSVEIEDADDDISQLGVDRTSFINSLIISRGSTLEK